MITLLSSRSWLAILNPALVSGHHLVWVIPASRVQADLANGDVVHCRWVAR